MSDMLHELENNEAILLMYIAGELPEEERREVAQMIQVDGNLRKMHESLKAAWDEGLAGIERLDAAEPMAFSREVAARQVGRMVRQWHVDRLTAPVAVAAPAGRRFHMAWWQSSLATAAALLIGFLVWWGMVPGPEGTEVVADGTGSMVEDALDNGFSETGVAAGSDRITDFAGLPQELQDDLLTVAATDLTGFGSKGLLDLERKAVQLQELSEN